MGFLSEDTSWLSMGLHRFLDGREEKPFLARTAAVQRPYGSSVVLFSLASYYPPTFVRIRVSKLAVRVGIEAGDEKEV